MAHDVPDLLLGGPPKGVEGISPATRHAPSGRPRTLRTVLLVLLVAALVTAGLVLVVQRGAGPRAGAEQAEPVPEAVLPEVADAAPVLPALATGAPVPVLDAVLPPLLAAPALGAGLSAQVVDAVTGEVLFERDPADPGTPASTAKLLTAVAALTALDPESTIDTTVVAGAAPGEVVLVGAGDPTLSTTVPSATYGGAPTVADLAAQVQAALAGAPVTRVVVDDSLFTGPLTAPGWGAEDAPSTYAAPVTAAAVDGARRRPGTTVRSGTPSTDAGVALAAALGVPSSAVALGVAPPGARELGRVRSAPVARLVEQMLSLSDNLLAEVLGRHVALARGLPASFDGASQGVVAAVADAGFDVTGAALDDTSGLATTDRVPAQLLVDVLRSAADGTRPAVADLLSGLPVAGWDGTLADRGGELGSAPGLVRAKTGTLLSVNALAGTVVTADGRLLVFAVLADGTTGSIAAAETALDRVAAALAACGC